MKYNLVLVFLLSLGCLMTGCATTSTIVPQASKNFHGTLWVQTASEYKANCIQTYKAAMNHIDRAIRDSSWTAIPGQTSDLTTLPVAVILDVDETVLDNSPYQAQLVLDGAEYDPGTWDQWVARNTAPAVPGAVEFINSMQDRGIEVIYITNRECKSRQGSDGACPAARRACPVARRACPQEQNTIDNLKKVGINEIKPENLLLKNEKPEWSSEKKSRRESVAKNYRVVMLFGDDLGDFLPDVKKNITYRERNKLVKKYESYWGSKWFMLSNPIYGSWLRVLDDPKSNQLRGY